MAQNDLGTFGSVLREAVSDPNAGRLASPVAPGVLPTGGISAPRTPDMSKAGSSDSLSVITSLLGTVSSAAGDFLEKQKDKDMIAGQMAYASGKTQEQIAATGNEYTMAGFQTLRAKTASNEWYQNTLSDINNTDKTIAPEDFQKKLSAGFTDLQSKIAGNDPFTRDLVTSLASETMPRLAAQQTASHNAWKQEQTVNAYTDMLVSEATKKDPTVSNETKLANLHLLTSPSYSNLPDEAHKQAITNATQLSLKLGDDSLYNALGKSEQGQIQMMNLGANNPKLHAAVMSVESNGNRNAVSPKGAASEMQVMDATNAAPGLGVRPAQNNSLAERARVGHDYLEALVGRYHGVVPLALAAYNGGFARLDGIIAKLGDGASVQDAISQMPPETRKYVPKVLSKMNSTPGASPTIPMTAEQIKASGSTFNAAESNASNPQGTAPAVSTPAVLNVAQQSMNTKLASSQALLNAQFTPAQIETIASSYDQFQNKKTSDFNAQRVMDEQGISERAKSTGNLPQALNEIAIIKQKNNYSDAWANSQAESARSSIESGRVEREAIQRMTTAVATNTLSSLSHDELPKALAVARATVSGQVQAAVAPAGVDAGEWKKQQFRSQYADILIKNNVVDSSWSASMSSSFESNMTDNSNGSLRPAVTKAYDDYQYLSQHSSPGFAQQFLSDKAKVVVNQVDAYAADGLNVGQALRTVADIEARKASGAYKDLKPDPDAIAQSVSDMVKKMTPGFFSSVIADPWGTRYATTWWGISNSALEDIKNNPLISSVVQSQAERVMAANPGMPAPAAVGQAAADVQQRVDYIGNEPVIAGPKQSVRGAMGITSTAEGAVNKAAAIFMGQYGHKLFGAKWDEQTAPFAQMRGYNERGEPLYMTVGGVELPFSQYSQQATNQSLADWYAGQPRLHWKYNPDDNSFLVDMYTNKEGTRLLGQPIHIKATAIGQHYNAYSDTHVPLAGRILSGIGNAIANTPASTD